MYFLKNAPYIKNIVPKIFFLHVDVIRCGRIFYFTFYLQLYTVDSANDINVKTKGKTF